MNRPLPALPGPLLAAILVAEGYASLGTEILALRRIVPFAGNTVSVTAVVVAVYLAALAGGYRRGGRLALAGDPRPRLAVRLSLAAALAAVWLSDTATTAVFSLPLPELAQVTIYATAGIAPIGWLLAECVLLAHAARCARREAAGLAAGGVFALSTVGNVAGALVPTFIIFPTWGVAASVIALWAALVAASIVADYRRVAAVWLGAAALFPVADLWVETTQYVARNAHADYRIVAAPYNPDARVLLVAGQPASRHDADARGWEYAEVIETTLCEAGETRVLVLGAAGMTLGKGAPCDLSLTYVDIDPAQERIAAEFLQTERPGALIAADARAFLRTDASEPWPAIVVDTFSNAKIVPDHLLTVEFYRLLRSRLAPGGSLYVNHVAYPDELLFLGRADRTLRAVFASCATRAVVDGPPRSWNALVTAPHNRLYRCLKNDHDGDTAIYSDAAPRADLDRGLR